MKDTKRFIVVVLDSFGVGTMSDVPEVRPQDIGSNTAKHLLELNKNIHWDTLFELGLINALQEEVSGYKMSPEAVFGRSNLAHYGGDTYFGHQEIMGTKPMKPVLNHFTDFIAEVEEDLQAHGYSTKRYQKDGLELLCVNDCIFVGDNLETDPGQAINVTGSFDLSTFEEIRAVGKIVRKHVQVSRVIAFGGTHVTLADLENAIEVKNGYIGVNAPKSKVYQHDYQVVHIGYGVDTEVQVPAVVYKQGIKTFLYGKVADIVENPHGKMVYGVDTETLFHALEDDLRNEKEGFFCLNVQETDLAGHQCNPELYTDRLNVSSKELATVISLMGENDILVVMADHGNDPTADSTKHSREMVPLLLKKAGVHSIDLGLCETMADVGATAAEYFGTKLPFGTSFLKLLAKVD